MKTRTSRRQQTALLLTEPVPRITPERHGKSPTNRQSAGTTTTTSDNNNNNSNRDHEDIEWNHRYDELVLYAEQHGNCLVPRRYPPNRELAAWVSTQRQNYRLFQEQQQQQQPVPRTAATVVRDTTTTVLSPERIQKLQDLGFCWQDTPTTATATASSNPETRQSLSEEPSIVSEEEQEWNSNFAALNDFVAVHGHANVPNRFPSNPKLCRWVVQQRQSYKQQQQQQQPNAGRRQRNGLAAESSAMTKEHQAALESIGFQWNTEFVPTKFQTKNSEYDHDQVWNQRFQELKRYYEEHDHCDVPSSVNPSLAAWVTALRREYQKQDQGQGYCLTDAQRFNLEKMDFSISSKPLEPSEREWFERYRELRQYQERHQGSTAVPWNFPGGLGKWVAEQRRAYQKRQGDASSSKMKRTKTTATSPTTTTTTTSGESLTDAQIEKLDDIDFDWQVNANEVVRQASPDANDDRRSPKNGDRKNATSEIRGSSSQISSKKEDAWQEHFAALVQYQAEHDGDTAVPRVYPPNPALADWVVQQRRLYQEQQQKTTSKRVPNGLTAERLAQLNSIHFQWEDEEPPSNNSARKTESNRSIDNRTTAYVKDTKTTMRGRPKTISPEPNNKQVPTVVQVVNEQKETPSSSAISSRSTDRRQTRQGNDITQRVETPTRSSTTKETELRGSKSPTTRSGNVTETAVEGTSKSWTSQLDDLKNYLQDHNGQLPIVETALGKWVENQRKSEDSLSLEQWKQLQVVLGAWPRKDTDGALHRVQANEKQDDVEKDDDDDDDDDDIMLSSLKSHKRKAKPEFDQDDDNMPLIYLKKRTKRSSVIQDSRNRNDDDDDDRMLDEDDMPLIFLKHKKVFHKRTTDDIDDDDIMLSSLRKKNSKPATIQKDEPMKPPSVAPTTGTTNPTKKSKKSPAKPKHAPDAAANGTAVPKQQRRPSRPKQQRRPRAGKNNLTVPPPPPFFFPHLAFLQQQQLPFPPPFFFPLPPMPFAAPPLLPWDMSTQFPPTDATGAIAPTDAAGLQLAFDPLLMNLPQFSVRPPSPMNNQNTPFGDAVIGETAEI